MNKSRLLAIISILAVLIVGGVVYYIVSITKTYTVAFELESGVSSVAISSDDNPKIASVKNNESIQLRKGVYYYSLVGKNLATSAMRFEVGGDMSITVPITYTTDYLDRLAEQTQPTIAAELQTKYSSVMTRYDINSLTIFDNAKWGGVVITPKGMLSNSPTSVYRALLEYKDGSWKLNGAPQPVVTEYTNKGVSVDILTKVNDLTPN